VAFLRLLSRAGGSALHLVQRLVRLLKVETIFLQKRFFKSSFSICFKVCYVVHLNQHFFDVDHISVVDIILF
jgi:hypothetical protein